MAKYTRECACERELARSTPVWNRTTYMLYILTLKEATRTYSSSVSRICSWACSSGASNSPLAPWSVQGWPLQPPQVLIYDLNGPHMSSYELMMHSDRISALDARSRWRHHCKPSGEEQRKQLINRRQQCQGPVVGAIGCVTQFEHDNNNPLMPGGGRLFR